MSNFHCDTFSPNAINTAVDGSTTVVSDPISLNGTVAVNVQVVCKNGAAGTLYIDGTNQVVPSGENQASQALTPVWVNATSQALTANQTLVQFFSLTDQITSMSQMRCRFAPTSAGNVQVSVNARGIDN